MTENVKGISHAAARRRNERRRAVAPLREKSSSVTFIYEDRKMTPDVGLEQEVILFYRLPGWRAGVRFG